jgi:hypothetical protein
MSIWKIRVAAAAVVAGLALLGAPASANADAGSYCGHGHKFHWHGITENFVDYHNGYTRYEGSSLVHHHVYNNVYVYFAGSYEEDQNKVCPRH